MHLIYILIPIFSIIVTIYFITSFKYESNIFRVVYAITTLKKVDPYIKLLKIHKKTVEFKINKDHYLVEVGIFKVKTTVNESLVLSQTMKEFTDFLSCQVDLI